MRKPNLGVLAIRKQDENNFYPPISFVGSVDSNPDGFATLGIRVTLVKIFRGQFCQNCIFACILRHTNFATCQKNKLVTLRLNDVEKFLQNYKALVVSNVK